MEWRSQPTIPVVGPCDELLNPKGEVVAEINCIYGEQLPFQVCILRNGVFTRPKAQWASRETAKKAAEFVIEAQLKENPYHAR